jgi:hypothetical protein
MCPPNSSIYNILKEFYSLHHAQGRKYIKTVLHLAVAHKRSNTTKTTLIDLLLDAVVKIVDDRRWTSLLKSKLRTP